MTIEIDEARLAVALHEQVRDEWPDADQIIERATAYRRRVRLTRLGGSLAVAVVIGALAIGTPWSGEGANDRKVGTATAIEPSSSAPLSRAEQEAVVRELMEAVAPGTPYVISPRRPSYVAKHPSVSLLSEPLPASTRAAIAEGLPPGWGFGYVRPTDNGQLVNEVPMTVPSGWTCQWFLEDDKAACTSADGGVAGLVIRPASQYDEWASSPDKGANSSTYVTQVRDGIFITVQTGRGTTAAEIHELGAGLGWVN